MNTIILIGKIAFAIAFIIWYARRFFINFNNGDYHSNKNKIIKKNALNLRSVSTSMPLPHIVFLLFFFIAIFFYISHIIGIDSIK